MSHIKKLEPGSKVKFTGVPDFVYPHFNNLQEFAKNTLEIDKIYTIRAHRVFSSWQSVCLEEINQTADEKEIYCGDWPYFNLCMFETGVE